MRAIVKQGEWGDVAGKRVAFPAFLSLAFFSEALTSSSMNYHLYGRIEPKREITNENSYLRLQRARSDTPSVLQKQGIMSYWTEH